MKIAFCSNFLSSHQRPLCDAIYESTGSNFRFIASKPLSETRKSMGWKEEVVPYLIRSYTDGASYQEALDYVTDADVLIISGDDENEFLKIAIKNPQMIIFRCSERPYKNGRWRMLSPKGLIIRWNSYYKYPRRNLYMLCCSAYAAGDYALLGSYLARCYKWGYFTKVEAKDVETTIAQKKENFIFWAGRLLDWKQPELALVVASYLKKRNISFQMSLAGDGPMRQRLQDQISALGLSDYVQLVGMLSQEEIRHQMQCASIFLGTSNYQEGWGAVIGEAMSCACAVVACDAMGAVPFLIRDGQNGYTFRNGNKYKLCQSVEKLIGDKHLRCQIGMRAYETMTTLWNPNIAAERLLQLVETIKSENSIVFQDGPCSKAHIFRKGR
jgi:glycosyltransferase involved in cell wall biosynthesis